MKKLIGTKEFYKRVLFIAVPMMVQNAITNFVALIDNIMVGQVGTDQMSGVAIINQLIFIFNLAIFGGLAGAGIYGAQFYGKKDYEGVRNAFRYKIMMIVVILAIAFSAFLLGGDKMIAMFLHEGGTTGSVEATFSYAKAYLNVMLFGLIPFAINMSYCTTLRETGQTVVPMRAGIVAVVLNLLLDYILIFGKLGLKPYGVVGAAFATVIARYVEMAIVVIWTHTHKKQNVFMVDVYKTLRIPKDLAKTITIKGLPLLLNEVLWSAGVAMLSQSYSTRGLATVAAVNINNTISNLFNIVFISLGSTVSIIVGQLLGAGEMEKAEETDHQLIAFSVFACTIAAGLMAILAGLFPELYKTTDEVKILATDFIRLTALFMPACAFTHATYFTLRSGGKTIITFIFDSVFMWVIAVPLSYILSRYTTIHIVLLYGIMQSLEVFKCFIGFGFLRSRTWLQNIVNE